MSRIVAHVPACDAPSAGSLLKGPPETRCVRSGLIPPTGIIAPDRQTGNGNRRRTRLIASFGPQIVKYNAASKPRWNGYQRLVGAFLLLLVHQVSPAGTEHTTAVGGSTNPENSALSHERLVTRGYDPVSINLDAVASDPKTVGDEVVLADGDVIRGTITSEDENEVVLLHPVFNEMRIPRDRIVAIRRQAPPRRGAGCLRRLPHPGGEEPGPR